MQPIDFPQSNLTLTGSHIKGCRDLHVYRGQGQIVSCWQLTPAERFEVMRTGVVWLHVMAGETSPPVALQTENPFVALPSDPATEVKG